MAVRAAKGGPKTQGNELWTCSSPSSLQSVNQLIDLAEVSAEGGGLFRSSYSQGGRVRPLRQKGKLEDEAGGREFFC